MRKVLGAGAVLLLLATGCAPDAGEPDYPGGESAPSKIDVDTPELRQAKQAAGVEPCTPGTGTDGPLPAVTLPCFGGGEAVDLSTLEGPLVLNYWASNCGPCRTEMPVLQEFHERYADQVPVVGIDYLDTQPGFAMALVQDTGATYPLLADPGGELEATELRTLGLPHFVFLGADGEVARASGGVESLDDMVALVEKHLGITL